MADTLMDHDLETTANRVVSDAAPLGFFCLARELRDQIYGYILHSNADWIRPIDHQTAASLRASHGVTRRFGLYTGKETWPFPDGREYITTTSLDNSLLLVNRQMHFEAKRYLLENHPVLLGCRYSECGTEPQQVVERYPEVARYALVLAIHFQTTPDVLDKDNYGSEILKILANRMNVRGIRFLCADVLGQWFHASPRCRETIKNRLAQLANIMMHGAVSVEIDHLLHGAWPHLRKADDVEVLQWLDDNINWKISEMSTRGPKHLPSENLPCN